MPVIADKIFNVFSKLPLAAKFTHPVDKLWLCSATSRAGGLFEPIVFSRCEGSAKGSRGRVHAGTCV